MAGSKVAYTDTMVFEHYPPLAEIDWRAVVDADDVELVVSNATFYELDRHKDQHPHRGVRTRVRKALSDLERRTPTGCPVELREGNFVAVELESPADGYERWGLSKEVADDRLILAMISRRERDPGREVVLVSGDAPARMKAMKHGFQCYAPPADRRFEDPLDEYQRLLAEKEKEIARLRAQRPELTVTLAAGGHVSDLVIPPLDETLEEYLARELAARTRGCSRLSLSISGFQPADALTALRTYGFSPADISLYNERARAYYSQAESYLREAFHIAALRRRAVRLDAVLMNRGGAPASRVQVRLAAPDGIRFYTARSFPKPPEEPGAPERPSLSGRFTVPPMRLFNRDLELIRAINRSQPDLARPRVTLGDEGRDATVTVPTILQHVPEHFPELFISVEDPDEPRAFEIAVEIIAAELPEKVTCALAFRLPAATATS
jgi:hypothetical protein